MAEAYGRDHSDFGFYDMWEALDAMPWVKPGVMAAIRYFVEAATDEINEAAALAVERNPFAAGWAERVMATADALRKRAGVER